MNGKKTRPLYRFAALLVLGSWVSLASAADVDAAAAEATREAATASATAPDTTVAGEEATKAAIPQTEARSALDVLPKLSLPALLGTEVVEKNC